MSNLDAGYTYVNSSDPNNGTLPPETITPRPNHVEYARKNIAEKISPKIFH